MSDFNKPSDKQEQQDRQLRQQQAASAQLQGIADERSAKRERRRETMVDWPAANQHSPANSADNPEPSQQQSVAAKPNLEVVRRRQAAEQSDAGTPLHDQTPTFRNRPVLHLRVNNREGNGAKKN